jgi:putative SOS response-associated peptidase YedK
MCGRATLTTPIEEIAEELGVAPIPIGPPRFNIAPSTPLLLLRRTEGESPSRELALVTWGLRPFWAREGKSKRPFIQARAETVVTAPPFRDAFKHRRCLVVVDGFYEWTHPEGAPGQPHHIHRRDHRVLTLGGLWESYKGKDGALVETCAVVTTNAEGGIRSLHDRMPLVFAGADRESWLHAGPEEAKDLLARTRASQAERAAELEIIAVSRVVNDVKNDDPRCLAPANADPPTEGLLASQTTLPFPARSAARRPFK